MVHMLRDLKKLGTGAIHNALFDIECKIKNIPGNDGTVPFLYNGWSMEELENLVKTTGLIDDDMKEIFSDAKKK